MQFSIVAIIAAFAAVVAAAPAEVESRWNPTVYPTYCSGEDFSGSCQSPSATPNQCVNTSFGARTFSSNGAPCVVFSGSGCGGSSINVGRGVDRHLDFEAHSFRCQNYW